jgi:hypothetical protein
VRVVTARLKDHAKAEGDRWEVEMKTHQNGYRAIVTSIGGQSRGLAAMFKSLAKRVAR